MTRTFGWRKSGNTRIAQLTQYLTLVEDEEEQIAESRITDVFRLKVSEKAEDQDDDSSGSEEEDWY